MKEVRQPRGKDPLKLGEDRKPGWAKTVKARRRMPERLLRRLERNKGFVCQMAWRYAQAFGIPSAVEDLVQEGLMGIIQADQDFEPACKRNGSPSPVTQERGTGKRASAKKDAGFLTYASFWIRNYMIRWAKKCARDVRVPENYYNRIALSFVSVDQPVGGDGTRTLEEILPAPNGVPGHGIEENEVISVLREAMSNLSCAQFEAVRLIFLEGKTHEEAGTILGVSHQAIAGNKQAGIRKLRGMRRLREAMFGVEPLRSLEDRRERV
jgi:RNA polymerase sigma factor (sigma-70 family)